MNTRRMHLPLMAAAFLAGPFVMLSLSRHDLALADAFPQPAAAPVTVHIANFAFAPATLTVAPGTNVTFVNDDGEPHTVTAKDHAFDSGGLDTNDRWSHTFVKPGTYAYFCALHPMMLGTVIVRDRRS